MDRLRKLNFTLQIHSREYGSFSFKFGTKEYNIVLHGDPWLFSGRFIILNVGWNTLP